MRRMNPKQAKKALGLQKDGKLSPCPDMPNCVCSHYPDDTSHFLAAIPFQRSLTDAKDRLRNTIASFPEARLVEEKGEYFRVEFISKLFKFVDDVEFLFLPEEKLIHFRSASRLGYWDLGANKKRMKGLAHRLSGI